MKKIKIILLIIFLPVVSCNVFFTIPGNSSYHKNSDIGGFPTGFYKEQVDGKYFYIDLGEDYLHYYEMNNSLEILSGFKASTSLEYQGYERYWGPMKIEYTYNISEEDFIESYSGSPVYAQINTYKLNTYMLHDISIWIYSMDIDFEGTAIETNISPVSISKPTDLNLQADNTNGLIIISWKDISQKEEAYVIERKIGESGTYAVLATLQENAETYTDTGLTLGNKYCYRIKAQKETDIYSDYSDEAYIDL